MNYDRHADERLAEAQRALARERAAREKAEAEAADLRSRLREAVEAAALVIGKPEEEHAENQGIVLAALDWLQKRASQAEVEAAVLRRSLEWMLGYRTVMTDGDRELENLNAERALLADAGRALLARVEAMERVVKAARAFIVALEPMQMESGVVSMGIMNRSRSALIAALADPALGQKGEKP